MQVAYITFTVKVCNSKQQATALRFINDIKQQKYKKSFEVETREPEKIKRIIKRKTDICDTMLKQITY
jgi:hypothetical protein